MSEKRDVDNGCLYSDCWNAILFDCGLLLCTDSLAGVCFVVQICRLASVALYWFVGSSSISLVGYFIFVCCVFVAILIHMFIALMLQFEHVWGVLGTITLSYDTMGLPLRMFWTLVP